MPSIIYELGAVVVGLAFVYFAGEKVLEGYRAYQRDRTAAAADPVSPGRASPGDTDLVGTVRATDTLETPLGEQDAVAFYLDTFVGNNEEAFPHEDETVAKPFTIAGDGESITVDTDDLTIATTDERERSYSSGYFFADIPEDLPDDVVRFLRRAEIPIPDGGRVGVEQTHVEPGETAYVHGEIERRDGTLTITGGDEELFVTDAPPDQFTGGRSRTLTGALGRAALLAVGGVGLTLVGVAMALA